MTLFKTVSGGALVFLLALTIHPAPVAAQDCSQYCGGCGWSEYEGYGADDDRWQKACSPGTGSCDLCFAPARVGDNTPEESTILQLINAATGADLAILVEEYRDHLLLHPERNLLAFRGLGCDPAGIGSVAFLSSEKTQALREAGAASLDLFVHAERANEQ